MLHPILVTAEKSPLLTAAEVMKHRNEKRPLTPDFCRGILASSGNPGVAAKLLQRIEMHLADYPEETSAYVPVLGALWFRSRHHARNMEVVARISLNGISASLAAAAPVLSAPASPQDQNASAAVSIFPASASSQNMTHLLKIRRHLLKIRRSLLKIRLLLFSKPPLWFRERKRKANWPRC